MILEKLQKGDMTALESLYDSLHKRLYLFLVRITKKQDVAEDILQSTFIKVWDNRNKLSCEKPLDAQVFVIARNLLLNYIKRQNLETQIIENLVGVNTEVKDGMQEVIFNDSFNCYKDAISQLPAKRKEIYKLRHIKGYSNKQIASKCNISTNTVDNHLTKANSFIRRSLVYLKESTALYMVLVMFIIGSNFY